MMGVFSTFVGEHIEILYDQRRPFNFLEDFNRMDTNKSDDSKIRN